MATQNTAPTFTVGEGKITTDFGTETVSAGYGVALQGTGKILLTGGFGNVSIESSDKLGKFALAQYNSDGSLDTLFGLGGKVITDFGGNARSESIAIQTDEALAKLMCFNSVCWD